jgi:hypothetical protein
MTRTRTVFAKAAVAALIAAQVAAPVDSSAAVPGATATDDSLTWSLVPATPERQPDDRQSFRLALDPGATATEYAILTNYSSDEVTFDLTASDGVIAEDGSFDILRDDEEPADSGAWISLEDQVTVPAEGDALVPFTVTVPADATPGDHPAGITAGVSAQSQSENGTAVGLQARVGLRVHLRVTGEIQAALAIAPVSVGYAYSWNPFAPGHVEVVYDVANTGNVRLESSDTVSAAGPFGLAPGEARDGEPRELLPGTSRTTTRIVDDAWPLVRFSTEITAVPGSVGEDDIGAAAPAAVRVTGTAWAVPWPQLIVIALVAGLVLLVRRLRTRRRTALSEAIARARAEGAAAARSAAVPARNAVHEPKGLTARSDPPPGPGVQNPTTRKDGPLT